jgi:glycerol-3-phosphate dehydrogenase
MVQAGVIGLACARAASQAGLEVVLLEQEASYGSATSSRHSEVIHAGIYYSAGVSTAVEAYITALKWLCCCAGMLLGDVILLLPTRSLSSVFPTLRCPLHAVFAALTAPPCVLAAATLC